MLSRSFLKYTKKKQKSIQSMQSIQHNIKNK